MFLVLVAAACSREAPAPPARQDTAPPPPAVETAAPRPATPSYADAVTWFRSTPGFHFELVEKDVFATGEMTRSRVGAERVTATVNGTTWTAEAGSKGVVWRRGGKEVPAPEWANRVWQRVTVAFDPEKREGEAQLVEPGHFRFTDANSGAVHDVWVQGDGSIAKMTIGDAVRLTINPVK